MYLLIHVLVCIIFFAASASFFFVTLLTFSKVKGLKFKKMQFSPSTLNAQHQNFGNEITEDPKKEIEVDNFSRLPKPILNHIFSQLTFSDVRLSRTNKLFHKIFSNLYLQLDLIEKNPQTDKNEEETSRRKHTVIKAKAHVRIFCLHKVICK